MNMNRFFIKLDRIAAWILMAVIIMYAITGYGMTKGIIPGAFARSLHLSWLGGIGLAAFVIHTSWAIHMACRRRQIWNGYTRFALIASYLLLAGFFLYINFFYTPAPAVSPSVTPIATSAAVIPPNQTTSSTSVPVTTPTPTPTKTVVFTAATLAAYNGLNGQPAYVAVGGVVYDVSKVFRNGDHHGYKAGRDLTAYFYSQHDASILSSFMIVGAYQK